MNQKKKRAMSLALASAVLLSQSSLVAFAEEPAANADAGRAADSSQKKTDGLLSFTAKSVEPITISNGFSVKMSDSSHNGVKDGDVIEESIIVRNPTNRDVTYYITAEGDDTLSAEFVTENSAEKPLTVKAGQNQVVDVKVTVKNPKSSNYLDFVIYEVPAGDVTTGEEVSAAVRLDNIRHYYYTEAYTVDVKISADFELAENYNVVIVNDSNRTRWYSSTEDNVSKDIIEVSKSYLEEFQTALIFSNNTIAVVEDFDEKGNVLKFSNKNNVNVSFKSNKNMSGVRISALTLPNSQRYIFNRSGIVPADLGFEMSLPKEISFCFSAFYPNEEHNWIVYKKVVQDFSADTDLNFEFKDFTVAKNLNVDTTAFNSYNMFTAISHSNNVEVISEPDGTFDYSPDGVMAVITDGKMQVPDILNASDVEIEMQSVPNPNGNKTVQYANIDLAKLNDGDTLELSNVYKANIIQTWDQEWHPGDIPWSLKFDNIVDAFGHELETFSWSDLLNAIVTLTNTATGQKYTTSFAWGLYSFNNQDNVFIQLPNDMIEGKYDMEIVVSGVQGNGTWFGVSTEAEGDGVVIIDSGNTSGYAPVGQNLFFSASAKPGSEFKYWEVSGITLTKEQIADPNLTFVMPNNEVTVKAVFDTVVNTTTSTEAPYLIKIGNSADGRISVSVNDKNGEATAAEGDKVRLEATPRAGFAFTKWTVEGVDLTDEQLAKSVLEFAMPANDVSVGAEFTAETPALTEYAVTVTTDGHGSATATPATAAKGTEITLTATPASGYRFNKWTVVKGDVTIKDNKFTMPESDVEVKAEFTRVSSSGGSSGGSSSGRRPSSSSTANETVTVNGKTGGWSDVTSTINTAVNSSTITISGNVEIPADVIAAAAAKNIKLEVKVNDTFTWVLDAAKVGAGSKYLSVADAVINVTNKTIKSTEASKDLRVTESGLGTGASLRYNAGKDNSGKFANLFRVNGSALEFIGVVKADAAGNALLPITAAGAYKIVISGETKLVGDLDNSMGLNALDAALMLKKLVMNEVTADEAAKFDFNGDGKTNALDAAAILKWIVNN